MLGVAGVSDRAAALGQAVPRFVRAVDPDALAAHVAQVCAHDRYQASRGIERAAALVADAAAAAGAEGVTIERFAADGRARWWSFAAPRAWTPLRARLDVRAAGGATLSIDHAHQPCAVATHAAPTPPGGVHAPLVAVARAAHAAAAAGAVALVERADDALLEALAAAGALGVVAGTGRERARGRIELPPHTSLFGFSVTADELGRLRAWAADGGASTHAEVVVDRGAATPVVTAVLPGDGAQAGEEVWLIAHLCHPRPSANDNASGVAALLGAAAALAAARRDDAAWGTARTIRLVWGPEIVGTAALLHRRLVGERGRAPVAVVNLDMVGAETPAGGGELVLERNPDSVPGPVAPVAELLAREVLARTRAHARVRSVPFAGFSDHALFAGPHAGAPAVMLCQRHDPFNHTDADAPDKLSPAQLARASAIGAALALALASDAAVARPVLARALEAWSARERIAASAAGGAWGNGLRAYVARREAVLRGQLDGAPHVAQAPDADGAALAACWEGPFNARTLLADLAARDAAGAALAARIGGDRGLHALLTNVAIRCDGTRTPGQLAQEVSFALNDPRAAAHVPQLAGALLAAGWAVHAPAGAAAPAPGTRAPS